MNKYLEEGELSEAEIKLVCVSVPEQRIVLTCVVLHLRTKVFRLFDAGIEYFRHRQKLKRFAVF